MKNLDKMKSLLESGEVDALLLTSEVNRHYAARRGRCSYLPQQCLLLH